MVKSDNMVIFQLFMGNCSRKNHTFADLKYVLCYYIFVIVIVSLHSMESTSQCTSSSKNSRIISGQPMCVHTNVCSYISC